MLTKFVFFLLVACASCELSKDILELIGEPEEPIFEPRSYNLFPQYCQKAGYSCHNCGGMVNCIENIDGSFTPNFVSCESGTTCDRNTSKCITGYNPDCHPTLKTYQFKCRQSGIFPNPFNYKMYHICSGYSDLASIGTQCPDGFSFDVNTLKCIIKLDNNGCERPINPCKNNGEKGLVAGNGRLIYQCSEDTMNDLKAIYPFLYHCYGDYKFLSGKCQDPAKYTGDVVHGGRCKDVGKFYSTNFWQYIECFSHGYSYIYNCVTGKYFDMKSNECVTIPY